MIYGNDGSYSDDPKLEIFHETRNNPAKAICIKDNPSMHGFGKTIKKGDIVIVDGTVSAPFGFAICVPDQCAFYDYTHFDLFKK